MKLFLESVLRLKYLLIYAISGIVTFAIADKIDMEIIAMWTIPSVLCFLGDIHFTYLR